MPWFGDPWPSAEYRSPICEDDADHIQTPVGRQCVLCEEAVVEGDRGTISLGYNRGPAGPYWTPEPTHVECGLRNVLGGAGHLAAEPHRAGHCGGGGPCDTDGGLSYRQSALLVWQWVTEMGTDSLIGAAKFAKVRERLQRDLEAARARG